MTTIGNDFGHAGDTWERTGGKGVIVGGKVYEEHTFNVRVGLALSAHLKRCGINEKRIQEPFKTEVSLRDRTNFYNTQRVDVVLSNHANANSDKDVKGICVFAWKDHEPSQRLQKFLVEEYERLGFETHGIGEHESEISSWTDLAIVRDTKMTACLIENGFMTNQEEFKKIFLDPAYATKCALAQARALCRFFKIPFKEEIKAKVAVKESDSADGKLTRGEKGPNVKILNMMLNTLEYTRKTDDLFDQYTEAALKSFQKDLGLRQDAIYTTEVGRILIQAIQRKNTHLEPAKLPNKSADLYRLAKLIDTRNVSLIDRLLEEGYKILEMPMKKTNL
ncbi:N-acetylmuramoyl-L-alanine amidase [Rossellomorea sp. DA94]|uniref:N-acetylmuramoyl-L-alanine amidase n=1 Tax=Rossellomorea sp. DA94 TaxID=3038653 RepID=UPI00244BD699|nr:N-acetylmuramoyl-L-alanine amidase [Rossellomorea sp. DA94]WGG44163.1 N-acetylmuramoyl-L-alanine amidase [Rossellomorea sp. DA94]